MKTGDNNDIIKIKCEFGKEANGDCKYKKARLKGTDLLNWKTLLKET